MDQDVQYIKIQDLVLWTENPRDPINPNADDQEVVNNAIADNKGKWSLNKLAEDMGDYYDFSELPTVVYKNNKPVVYDGNRRIILGKIKYGLVTVPGDTDIEIPDFPELIPCNVCKEKIALNNVLRKHSETGSWDPLERDIFLHKFMDREKSQFLLLDDETKIISTNQHLNKRFVKEEIFDKPTLEKLGFHFKGNRLSSIHSDEEAYSILFDISKKVEDKEISTRNNRGKVIEVLDLNSQKIIDKNRSKSLHRSRINFRKPAAQKKAKKVSPRTRKKITKIFGGKLYLEIGDVSNLYRDIEDLYKYYVDNKHSLSEKFPSIIRMSLRFIVELAANERSVSIAKYCEDNFDGAKKSLDQNIKTTLSVHNITKSSIVQLLQVGAHAYDSSENLDQTLALSIIVGSILTITHGLTD